LIGIGPTAARRGESSHVWGVAADFERWLAEQVSTGVSQVRDEADMNRSLDIVRGR